MVIAFRCRVILTANSTGVPSLSDRNQEAAACVELLPNERPSFLHEDALTRVRDLIVEGHIACEAACTFVQRAEEAQAALPRASSL